MSWNEMIHMRRLKERNHLNPFKLVQIKNNFDSDFYCRLSYLERSAVDLRFFYELPIARVADRMGMSWDGADNLIDHAVCKILSTTTSQRGEKHVDAF